jgi:hypothetical protein
VLVFGVQWRVLTIIVICAAIKSDSAGFSGMVPKPVPDAAGRDPKIAVVTDCPMQPYTRKLDGLSSFLNVRQQQQPEQWRK